VDALDIAGALHTTFCQTINLLTLFWHRDHPVDADPSVEGAAAVLMAIACDFAQLTEAILALDPSGDTGTSMSE
jgi:hypothetical protein